MRGTAMYIGGGGALWRKYNQQNNTKFKDNMNPDYGVYIVLFLMRFIRGPPLCVLLFTINFKGANAMKNDKNKIFFENVGKFGRECCQYNTETQNSVQIFLNEENCDMLDKQMIVNRFKKYVRVSMNNFRINIYKAQTRLMKREILSDDAQIIEEETYDDYDFLENKIAVMNFKMTIKNDLLYEVLNSMEQLHRNIVYLSLCENVSDNEIGKKLKMPRSTVQYVKQKLKKEIYDAMTGGRCDE